MADRIRSGKMTRREIPLPAIPKNATDEERIKRLREKMAAKQKEHDRAREVMRAAVAQCENVWGEIAVLGAAIDRLENRIAERDRER